MTSRRDKIDKLVSQYSNNQPLSANLKKKLGQELNKRGRTGNTLLLESVAQGDTESVEILVDCPIVDVNAQDDESGYTPLHKVLFSLVCLWINFLSRLYITEIFNWHS